MGTALQAVLAAFARMLQAEAEIIPTYGISTHPNPVAIQGLKEADFVFWSSPSQFKTYGSFAKKNAIHACGPGKTAQFLKRQRVSPLFVFPSAKEWKKWLK